MRKVIFAKGIIDGTGESVKNDVVVVVEGKKITNIESRNNFKARSEDITIDVSKDYLLPGFIDSHSHGPIRPGDGDQVGQLMDPPAIAALRSSNNLRRSLKTGVTTMRSMHAEGNLDVHLRESIENQEIPAPRLFISGGGVKPSSGVGDVNTAADTPDDIRRSIRRSVAMDADFIKIFCNPGDYSRKEIQLAIDEAHNRGRKISAHVRWGDELRECVKCGIDSIEHGAPVSIETLELMKERGVYWVATNTIFFHAEGLPKVDYQIHAPGTRRAEFEKNSVPEARIKLEEVFPKVISSGVKIALGSDSMHGLFPYELEYMVKSGASPMDAIIAATRRGAELIGIEEWTGTLEVGKVADIISVPGNPLEEIKVIWDVNLIMKDGERYDHISYI